MNNKENCFSLFELAYELTNDITPKKYDCGKLCGSACCNNFKASDSSDTGMALLPYEKEFLISKGADESSFTETGDEIIYVCKGTCTRSLRPFACRIFPYFSVIKNDKFYISRDPRAVSVCPLLSSRLLKRPSVYFLRAVRIATKILLTNPKHKEELIKTSDFIIYLEELLDKFK